MSTPRVAVLLSTFNGARYLPQQWKSLMAQTLQPEIVFVRDDGSTDETKEILAGYAATDSKVRIFAGKNVGPAESFLTLIREADDADYYALCDQDDVWLPEKLEAAANSLMRNGRAPSDIALYCGAYFIVDRDLNRKSICRQPRRPVGLENALVENMATGCTVVLSNGAKKAIESCAPDIDKIMMHDWWLYLVVSALGRVVWGDKPFVEYRQHDANAVGAGVGLQLWMRRLRYLLFDRKALGRGRRGLRPQAEELLRCFGADMDPDKRAVVEEFVALAGEAKFSRRVKGVRTTRVFRQSPLEDLILKIRLAAGGMRPAEEEP